MSGGEVSGVDLARVALRAAREAARMNGTGQKAKKRPRAATMVRRDGREPMGLGTAIGTLVASLLGTLTEDGSPIQLASTRTAGAVIVWPVGDRQERFEFTDVQLYDGTFTAEPTDRYETAR
ncbi:MULTISPECIES: hypothetical protein [unclassified Streptomyces]|uniref:hypothetical protein n=1 Tax=unclassified Streptomyces TaxID=2593676 RepID=UPI002F911A37